MSARLGQSINQSIIEISDDRVKDELEKLNCFKSYGFKSY